MFKINSARFLEKTFFPQKLSFPVPQHKNRHLCIFSGLIYVSTSLHKLSWVQRVTSVIQVATTRAECWSQPGSVLRSLKAWVVDAGANRISQYWSMSYLSIFGSVAKECLVVILKYLFCSCEGCMPSLSTSQIQLMAKIPKSDRLTAKRCCGCITIAHLHTEQIETRANVFDKRLVNSLFRFSYLYFYLLV